MKKRFEIYTTRYMFSFGFGWNPEQPNKHFALILGCVIIRYNLK